MLTQMEVFTPGVTAPPFPIVDQPVGSDFIQIKRIAGLGPVSANVNTTPYGSIDGESLDGTNTPKRNIVLTLALNPDWATQTIESLRQILYQYFMPENEVRLRFSSINLDNVEISGIVESCEPDLFSKDPEWQVSIICLKPFFVATSATVLTGSTQSFGAPVDVPITYDGSIPVGFIVDITMPSGGSPFSGEVRLLNNTPTTKLAIVTNVTVSSAAFFRMSTIPGDKYVRSYPLPSGSPTSIVGELAVGSDWLTLRKGVNKVRILTATAGYNWTLSYYTRYGGL